jgi:SAM-dependent methyltransferase
VVLRKHDEEETVMSTPTETFQLSLDAAAAYESMFVPALFGEWAPHLVEAAGVAPGHAVLDVACGTGVVARTAADRLAGDGTVTGVDLNEAMLTVAGRVRPDLDWRRGDAGALPFPDATFDVVLCQAALMFFPDRLRALREMARVVVPSGTVAVQVWAGLDAQPAYGPFVEITARHAGPEAVDLLSAYWSLGDREEVGELLRAAGLTVVSAETRLGVARFDSIDQLVRVEVESTPLIERIDDGVYEQIRAEAAEVLAPYRTPRGSAEVPIAGHVVVARR